MNRKCIVQHRHKKKSHRPIFILNVFLFVAFFFGITYKIHSQSHSTLDFVMPTELSPKWPKHVHDLQSCGYSFIFYIFYWTVNYSWKWKEKLSKTWICGNLPIFFLQNFVLFSFGFIQFFFQRKLFVCLRMCQCSERPIHP